MTQPNVFISATTSDLCSIRQIVKGALLTINCHPVEQDNFPPDARTVEAMLRAKIETCQALIHIVGLRYGAEPNPDPLPSGTIRHSYTQMEYLIGRQLQKEFGDNKFRVYTFICTEDFPYDEETSAETEEKRALQHTHRETIMGGDHLYETFTNPDSLEKRILAIPEKDFMFHEHQEKVTAAVNKSHDIVIEQGAKTREELKDEVGAIKAALKVSKAMWGILLLFTAIIIGGSWYLLPTFSPTDLSILVVMGENVKYEQIIRDAFLAKLEKGLAKRGYRLNVLIEDPKFERGKYASPHDSEGSKKWSELISGIEYKNSSRKIDFFVTLGTYATMAIKEAGLLRTHSSQGLIYLGVTDPIKAEFVNNPQTAGVQYGKGGREYGIMIDALFKTNQRLVFLYNDQVVQDEFFSEQLQALNSEYAATSTPDRHKPRFFLDRKGKEEPIALTHIEVPDPEHPSESAVYFAWYGLDNILGAPDSFAKIDKNKLWVVPSTYSNENLKSAGLIVSVDDTEVGEMGAEILLHKIDEPGLDLSQEPVKQPDFITWICKPTIQQNHLDRTIKPEILAASNDASNGKKYKALLSWYRLAKSNMLKLCGFEGEKLYQINNAKYKWVKFEDFK